MGGIRSPGLLLFLENGFEKLSKVDISLGNPVTGIEGIEMNFERIVFVAPDGMMVALVDAIGAGVHELDSFPKARKFDFFLDSAFAAGPAGKVGESFLDFRCGKGTQIRWFHKFILQRRLNIRVCSLLS